MLLTTFISLTTGKMSLSLGEILDVLFGAGTDRNETIIFQLRIPRIVPAILIGTVMGLAGAAMQTLLRNDMASPGTLGISAGSGLFVMLVIAGFQVTSLPSRFLLPALAFIGGVTAALIIFLLAYRRQSDLSPTSLILTGVAVGMGNNALSLIRTTRLNRSNITPKQVPSKIQKAPESSKDNSRARSLLNMVRSRGLEPPRLLHH
ncbi:FecCD family ABC transporter permease [Paenibacillus cisolokensis]|uniref:FecCD family ABC transporter permease n=1 Tax=Paenibacillus cisolokensis TaxID=1658519 RepID=UPI003D28794D